MKKSPALAADRIFMKAEHSNNEILSYAREFAWAAKLVNGSKAPYSGAIPAITLAAFAVELFLKSFNATKIHDSSPPSPFIVTKSASINSQGDMAVYNGHKPSELFKKLSCKQK